MASSSVTRRVAESYLTDLLEGSVTFAADVDVSAAVQGILYGAYDIEFKPRSRAGEVIVLTFQLDPNGAEQPEDG